MSQNHNLCLQYSATFLKIRTSITILSENIVINLHQYLIHYILLLVRFFFKDQPSLALLSDSIRICLVTDIYANQELLHVCCQGIKPSPSNVVGFSALLSLTVGISKKNRQRRTIYIFGEGVVVLLSLCTYNIPLILSFTT